jgi:membrane-bound lytic murein transglycosylase D
LLGVLASGASWPANAEPHLSSDGTSEFVAPVPSEDLGSPQASIEPNSETRRESEPPSTASVPDIDPWAYAFAESSRLQAVAFRGAVNVPVYEVAMNPQVKYFVDRFTSTRRDAVGLWFQRSGRYWTMVRDVLRSKGLPEDLAFTVMIESGFDSKAVSRAGAKGLWQFMAATARLYGLRVDHWVDERFDPEKSTVAAAAYLRDLHARYGSWELAHAAYNAGSAVVDKAMRATGSTDFWALARSRFLRRETKDFVPAIHAATVIGRDPGQYGFEFIGSETPEIERVAVPPATDLLKLSAKAGISLQMLKALNPTLIRGVTPPGATWEVRVPAGTRDGVLAAVAPPKRVAATGAGIAKRDDVHVVRPRDTVSSIAKLYGVSIKDVVRWNNLENGDAIQPGDRLRVTVLRPSVERDGQGGFR